MPQLSPHVAAVPGSGIRRLFEIALTLEGVTFLAVGEPDLPVAPHIARAAQAAWDAGDTNYTANGGIPPLRRAFAQRFAQDRGVALDPERVWVTVGGTQALHQALGLMLDPGDEVLVPDPGYTTFSMSPRMLSAVPVAYALREEAAFLPELDRLEALVTPRTRAIIVNSPSNPLGTVLDEEHARALLDFARQSMCGTRVRAMSRAGRRRSCASTGWPWRPARRSAPRARAGSGCASPRRAATCSTVSRCCLRRDGGASSAQLSSDLSRRATSAAGIRRGKAAITRSSRAGVSPSGCTPKRCMRSS